MRKGISKCCLFILYLISGMLLLPYIKTEAVANEIDTSMLNNEMQCAVAVNGIEYEGVLYFTLDNIMYRFTSDMAKGGEKAKIYLKNVDTDSGFFVNDGYIYFRKELTHSLYRVRAGDTKKELVTKGVHRILYYDKKYIYFWGKRYLYSVQVDGEGLKCMYRNKWNFKSGENYSTAYIYNGKLFYSKGLSKAYEGLESHDHKLCVQDLEKGSKKTLLNPKGCTGSFYFFELEGELFSQFSDYGMKTKKIFHYNRENESFEEVEGADGEFYDFVGTDGKYLYSVYEYSKELMLADENIPDNVGTSGVWKLFRTGRNWKQEYMFDINVGKELAYSSIQFKQREDDYYVFKYIDEFSICYCVDSKGNIVYSQKFKAGSKKNIQTDAGSVDMIIKDGKLYTLSHSLGLYADVNIRKLLCSD